MPEVRHAVLPVTLLATGLALLAAGQPWSSGTRVDAAGIAWDEVRTGTDLAPVVTALLLVEAVAALAGARANGWAGGAVRALTVLAAAAAAVATCLARPAGATAWFWVCLLAGVVAAAGALVLLPGARAGTMAPDGPLGPSPDE